MHQRELRKICGVNGTVFIFHSNRALLKRNKSRHELIELTGERRIEKFVAKPGFAAHGKAVSILKKWWNRKGECK